MLRMRIALCLVASLVACSGNQQQQSSATSSPTATSAATAASAAPMAAATSTPTAGPSVFAVSFTDINGVYGQQAIVDLGQLGVLDSTSGAFRPSVPITRAQYVRWLVKADNVYFKNDPAHQIRLAQGGPATFKDMPPNNPDFAYIQGLANSGFVIGLDATHFRPNQSLTREQMIGIKASVDEGSNIGEEDEHLFRTRFTDGAQISPHFVTAVAEEYSVRTTQDVSRIWGMIRVFRPTALVTRSEAAIGISEIGSGSAAVALGRTPPPPSQ